MRCRERSVATGGGGAYGWARRHARGLGAIVEGATRTFQGHRVGELVLGALLEDLRGGRDGQSRSCRDRRVSRTRRSQARARLSVADVAREASTPKPLARRCVSTVAETTCDTSRLGATRRGLGPARRKRVVGSSSSRAGCRVRSGKWRATDRFPRERARTCMTVSGVRPAGPAPMRISAVAVGETSSGMVVSGRREVEWNARARVSLVSMSDSFARTAFISQELMLTRRFRSIPTDYPYESFALQLRNAGKKNKAEPRGTRRRVQLFGA